MHKGFTLIELLIVVVIVGILVTIALPQYKRAAERGRATVGVTILRQLADRANAIYVLNNNEYPSRTSTRVTNIGTELVGIDSGDHLFRFTSGSNVTCPAYFQSNTQSATVCVQRDPSSGWRYQLSATLQNGEIRRISCSGYTEDCAKLGLNNL